MAQVNKIDSNFTGLRYAIESSLGVLPGTPAWKPLEPNSYNDFGGQLTTVARNPINSSRQRKKGVVTDLDASGGFNSDLTQTNMQELLQGFFFASLRENFDTTPYNGSTIVITGAVASNDRFTAASGFANVPIGALIVASGFTNAANNGLHLVDGAAAGYIDTASSLVDEVPPAAARIVEVGYQFAADEVDIDVAGSLPKLVSTLLVAATGTLTLAGNPADGDTVTIGTTVYTFETGALDTAYKVDVGADASASIDNLIHAINGTGTPGTHYATGTVAHPDVTAVAGTGDTMDVTAILAGAQGNAIATTETFTNGSSVWGAGTLASGAGKNLRDFDTIFPGVWVFLGGDATLTKFTAPEDNGFKRVKSVATDGSYIEFDKSFEAMSAEASSGSKTIQLFFGRVLKNELDTLIVRRTFQLERTLGAPDTAQPTQIQSEYLVGSVPSEFQLNVTTADKITCDLSFVSTDAEQRTAVTGLKSGTRPALVESDAFNTSSDFARIKIASLVAGNEAPDPLFAFAQEVTLTLNNNVSPNKAISRLGAFEVTAGTFAVSGSITAYFANVEAVQAVRNNADVTLDFHMAKSNAGVSVDVPLITLGDGRATIEQDQPITIPLSMEAATGAKYDANMDHTLLIVFYDYLPDAAE